MTEEIVNPHAPNDNDGNIRVSRKQLREIIEGSGLDLNQLSLALGLKTGRFVHNAACSC